MVFIKNQGDVKMKINDFCSMPELSSILKIWSKLTGLKVDIADIDGKVIATSAESTQETVSAIGLSENSDGNSDSVNSRTASVDLKVRDEVVGTVTVTDPADTNADFSVVVPMIDTLLNSYVSNQYYIYANDKVLSRLSDDISETIGLVKKVISSTNNLKDIQKRQKIVAINASIEAARVGQAGRGFAVVAEEVKKLSDASSEANNKIERVVTQIRDIVSTLSLDNKHNV
jgi:hypothetical protein